MIILILKMFACDFMKDQGIYYIHHGFHLYHHEEHEEHEEINLIISSLHVNDRIYTFTLL